MGSIVRPALRTLATTWHKVVGRVAFHIGGAERARHHFERVLELKGDDFAAYVYLGRLAHHRGDIDACRREYEHARRIAPERFARLRLAARPQPGPRLRGSLVEEASERATWVTPKVSLSDRGGPLAELRAHASEDLGSCPDPGLLFFGDDFLSDAEREKFRRLPPLRPEDLAATDLNELLRKLG